MLNVTFAPNPPAAFVVTGNAGIGWFVAPFAGAVRVTAGGAAGSVVNVQVAEAAALPLPFLAMTYQE
jgi:hypothetical protein